MTVVMLSGAAALLLMSGQMANKVVVGFSDSLVIERNRIFDTGYLPEALATAMLNVVWGLAPFALILMVAVFASVIPIGGWSFSIKAVAFKPERMNPIKGFKRIFSVNSLMELVKALGKFSVVATVAIVWLWWSIDELLLLGRLPINVAIRNSLEMGGISLLVVSAGLIVITMIDVPFQLWNYQKKLRMTRTEVRDEFKETEGRPEVKSKIRSLQQQAATRRMMEAVPDADVVVTNPTHVAVALKFDDKTMGAPKVVAKGKDLIAARVREIAEENNVPLFSAPPLARVLFRTTKLEQEIPAGLYTAVAQVLTYIYQIRDGFKLGQKFLTPPVPKIDESEF